MPFLTHETYMRLALAQARLAEGAGEVPVGAVVVDARGEILAAAHNAPVARHDPTAHAEIVALRAAGERAGNYRLAGATLYATLEPCAMCAGAIVHARIQTLVFGARDLRFGAVRSKFTLADNDLLNHQAVVIEGVLGDRCSAMLLDFFARKRSGQ